MRVTRLIVILSFLLLAGCRSDSGRDGWGVSVRDSAGITLIEHAGPADTVAASESILTIGREGDPDYEFFRVRRVLGLSDGRIVVANAGTSELRYFSAEGRYLASVGGEGEGPGEFRFMNVVQLLPGDTVAVNDARMRRVSLFSPEPAFVESISWAEHVRLEPPDPSTTCAFPGFAGLVWPRAILLRGWACAQATGSEGVVPYVGGYTVWQPGGESPILIGSYVTSRAYERPAREPRDRFAFLRLGERSVVEAHADGIYITEPDRFAFTVRDAAGRPQVIVRDRMPRRAIIPELHPAIREARSEASRDLPMPDSLPAFDGIVIGADQIWFRMFPLPTDSLRYWTVYRSRARERAIVGFPREFELSSVVGDRAYGTARDELDVARVRVFRVPNTD